MKSRLITLVILAFLLSACNFSLAEDITPPPNYVPPTPVPTLGPLFPAEAPSLENGAAIYAEKCAACHGESGMGDGAQGRQLPVTVAGLALPQTARPASPAEWYTIVSRGNIERFMPPFASLSEQERWDVVAYSLSLHTTPEQIEYGKQVFETNCAGCPLDFFQDQAAMSTLSADELAALLKNGNDKVAALGGNLTSDDLYAAAAYLRTLTFAASIPTPEPITVTPTIAAPEATPTEAASASTTPSAEAGTAIPEATPSITATSPTSTPEAVVNKVTGSVIGKEVAGITVTLRGFDHATDASGPQETITLNTDTDANGNYVFENLEMPEGRIYIADATYQGVTYNSDFAVVEMGTTELTLPPLKVYETSTDLNLLTVNQWHVIFDVSGDVLQVIEFISLTNATETTIIVPVTDNTMPLAPMPSGVTSLGYDAQQGEAQPVNAETGFALPPSEMAYGMLAGFQVSYDKKADVTVPFALEISSGSLLVPLGIKVKGDGLVDAGQQDIGNGTMYQIYEFSNIQAGESLSVSISGAPQNGDAESDGSSQQNLLIGLGVFGGVLIAAGVWMYLRERNRPIEDLDEDEENDEFESEEDILDAIIALDDLHRSGKINDEAYRTRRDELKARLK